LVCWPSVTFDGEKTTPAIFTKSLKTIIAQFAICAAERSIKPEIEQRQAREAEAGWL
jgi:hypothetical protein